MTYEIKTIYIAGRKNKQFLAEIKSADGDTKPNVFSSEFEKHIFATIYYGWLVGKHGDWWQDYL